MKTNYAATKEELYVEIFNENGLGNNEPDINKTASTTNAITEENNVSDIDSFIFGEIFESHFYHSGK